MPLIAGAAYMRGKAARIGLAGEGDGNLWTWPTEVVNVGNISSAYPFAENAWYPGLAHSVFVRPFNISGINATTTSLTFTAGAPATYGIGQFKKLAAGDYLLSCGDDSHVMSVVRYVSSGDAWAFDSNLVVRSYAADISFTAADGDHLYNIMLSGITAGVAITYSHITLTKR